MANDAGCNEDRKVLPSWCCGLTLPSTKQGPLSRGLGWAAIVIVLAAAFLPLFQGRFLNSDMAALLHGWDNAVGNSLRHPRLDPTDISLVRWTEVSWWPPGPAFLLGSMENLLGSLPLAMACIHGLCLAAQASGWALLLRRRGFEPAYARICVLLGLLSWHSLYSCRIFLAGDVQIWALLPWALLLFSWGPRSLWRGFTGAALLCAAGVWFKHSWTVVLAGLLLGQLCWHWLQTPEERRTKAQLVSLFGGATFGWLFGRLVLVAAGSSPLLGSGLDLSAAHLFKSACSAVMLPALSVASLGSVQSNILSWFGLNGPGESMLIGACTAVAASLVYLAAWQGWRSPWYRSVLLGLLISHIGAFFVLYSCHSAVSTEDRLTWPCGMVLLPGLVLFVSRGAGLRLARWGVALLLIITPLWGLASVINWLRVQGLAPQDESRGFRSLAASPAMLGRMQALYQGLPPGSIVIVPFEDLTLMRVSCRIMASSALPQQGALHGRVPALAVLLREEEVASSLSQISSRFVDMPAQAWCVISLSEGWVCAVCQAEPTPVQGK